MKRILFIGKRYYTNRDALTECYGRIYQLPLHWSRKGFNTTLWLLDYHGKDHIETMDGALRVVSTPVRRWPVLQELMRFWSRQRVAPPDLVVASGDCYIGLLGYHLARRHRARFVFDVYDKYDEFGGYRRLPRFDPFHFLLTRSDWCLFASRALMESSGSGAPVNLFVPNGVDTEHFTPRNMQLSRRQSGLPSDVPLIGYFGSLDKDRGIDDLLEAVKLLRASGYSLELVVAGKARPGLDMSQAGVHYLGNLPYAQVPSALASCNLLVLPYRISPYLDMASSCKIAEYFHMGKPVAATRTPNLATNFPQQTGELAELLAEPDNPADLARVIQAQLTVPRVVAMSCGFDWESISTATIRALFE